MTSMAEIHISKFSVYRENAEPLHYSSDGDELHGVACRRHGNDQGALMVRFDVDGDHDQVHADLSGSSDVRVLTRAIDALVEVRSHLTRMLPEGSSGRCMSVGEWGRCKLHDGHEEVEQDAAGVGVEHSFPTEEEWQAVRRSYPRSA